jgi:hypothetical protein
MFNILMSTSDVSLDSTMDLTDKNPHARATESGLVGNAAKPRQYMRTALNTQVDVRYCRNLSYPERLVRIGLLLAKGVALLLQHESEQANNKSVETVIPASAPTASDSTTDEILSYLMRVGSASPRDVQRALDLSKATAFRKLSALVRDGKATRRGTTTAIRYQVTSPGSCKPRAEIEAAPRP